MKNVKTRVATMMGFALLAWTGLRAEIEFSGFLKGPDGALVTLKEGPNGPSSGWLKPGQSFQGYTVVASDARRVVLEQNGHQLERPLREAKVKDGRMVVRGAVKAGRWGELPQIEAALFVGEEAVLPLREGLTLRLRIERRPDGNLLYRARFLERRDGRDDELSAPGIIAIPGQPFRLRVGEYGFEFTPSS